MRPVQREAARQPQRLPMLRVFAGIVALLLLTSSLGQVAHFLLVRHAICAEHGELLELGTRLTRAPSEHDAHDAAGTAQAHNADGPAGHDHCQILARAQRELVLPPAPLLATAPLLVTRASATLSDASKPTAAISLLRVAPKTSPPPRTFG